MEIQQNLDNGRKIGKAAEKRGGKEREREETKKGNEITATRLMERKMTGKEGK